MADPREYPKALALCRGIATSVYLTIGIVVYYYCGDYVASPALGSAGVLMKKVCYGLAIPGLIMSMTLYLHVSRELYPTFESQLLTASRSPPSTYSLDSFEDPST